VAKVEDWLIDCCHKKVFDKRKEELVVMSVDYESRKAIPRNAEALEEWSTDYRYNQVKVTKEAREEWLHHCTKGKVYS
jgi:hypothetical protein